MIIKFLLNCANLLLAYIPPDTYEFVWAKNETIQVCVQWNLSDQDTIGTD